MNVNKGKQMKRVVLTGPTGAIGVALIEHCIKNQVEVYAICRKGSSRIGNIPKDSLVQIVECDLSELNVLTSKDIPQSDVFYHFGWDATIGDGRNDMRLQLKNVQYTIDAVELAERLECKAFVGAGSQAEYGRFEGKLNGNVPTFPETGYGIAKLCAGQMSRIECRKRQIRHVWTRILSIYGPYDSDKTMVASTIKNLLEGKTPKFTKGEQQWDYLYSADAAKALYLLGERGIDGKIYCIGSGSARPLAEYIEILRDTINPDAELGIGEVPYSENQVMYLCADIEELKVDTGYIPEIPFEEGIRNTIEWMKKRD